ncbi:MAG TPA: hypothetical protein ENN43_07405 [bacterium]|nr:hypothetical protein [bacterium]
MLTRAITRTFWLFYDNLFKGLLLNLMSFIVLFGLFALFFMKLQYYEATPVTLMFVWHIIAPPLIGYWYKLLKEEENNGLFREIGAGLIRYTPKALVFFAVNAGFFYLAYFATSFYRSMAAEAKLPALILGGIGLWVLLVFIIMQLYLLPVFVLDEKKRVFTSYKKSAIMVMSAPFSSVIGVFIIGMLMLLGYPLLSLIFGSEMPQLMALLSLFPIFLMPFLSIMIIVILQLNMTVLIYEKHGVAEPLTEIWENKGLSNIFRPWDNKK